MKTLTAKKPTKKPKYNSSDAGGFSKVLWERVDTYFLENSLSKKGGLEISIKTLLHFAVFLGSYILLLSNIFTGWGIFLCGLVFGLTHVLIVFNIAHDAAHNALFKNPKLNKILSYSFNLVGANGYLWNITHNKIHHTYPNVGEYDPDIHQQAPFLRVSPSVKPRWFHRFQPYYASFLYLSYSLFLVFQKDYQDFRLIPKSDSKLLLTEKHPFGEYLVFFFSKFFYYGYTIVIPFLVIDVPWPQFVLGYIAIHACMSILLASVLIPVHMVDESEFAMVDESGSIRDSWAVHVFKNTTDYSRKNKLTNWFFGGLNTHLVHHLFPGICHVHYIALSDILKETALEFKLNYHDVSMREAIASHYRLLKRMSN